MDIIPAMGVLEAIAAWRESLPVLASRPLQDVCYSLDGALFSMEVAVHVVIG